MPPAPHPLMTAADIPEAFALLTRLPVGGRHNRGAAAAWAWPLTGLAVALLAGMVGVAALGLGLPAGPAAALVLGVQIAATGALHEDGLADTADGFWGGSDPARRLEIMKDSRIGSFGVIALALSLVARWSALAVLIGAGGFLAPLLAAATLSRAPMAVLMAALPNARGAGLAAGVGRPSQATATLGVIVALGTALAIVGWALLAPALWIALTAIGVAAIAKARIGGQTGDVLGAVQQLAEIAALFVFAATA